MVEKGYCSAYIYGDGRGGSTCDRLADRVIDGKPRCWQHDPKAVAARKSAQSERIQKVMALEKVFYAREGLRNGAIAALRNAPPQERLAIVEQMIARDDALTAEYEKMRGAK